MDTRDHILRIGARVKELRQYKGMTQAELADLVGCNQSAIGRLESTEKPPERLALTAIVEIAEGLGVPLEVKLG